MMNKCPECGSNDIVPDLNVQTEETTSGGGSAYVKLVEPEPAKRSFMWTAQEVKSTFQAAICGNCGYTRLYAKDHAEILEAQKKVM